MRVWILFAAINGLVGVACGAFAAHVLDGGDRAHAAELFRTASSYELIHALALLAVAWAASRDDLPKVAVRVAGVAFTLGCLLFAGSLYLFGLSDLLWLVYLTPVGGTAFLIGWIALGLAAVVGRRKA